MRDHALHTDAVPAQLFRRWYRMGKEEEDAVFRFVAYWIAFNQLYNYGITDFETESETSRIYDYCKKNIAIP